MLVAFQPSDKTNERGLLDEQTKATQQEVVKDEGDRVRVSFDHAAPREVDLVVGTDGLHSRIRELAFGPEASFEVSLGYHVAAFEVEGYRPREELVFVSHGVPGRQISRLSMR